MASVDKNIQIRERADTTTWNNLFPKTKSDIVFLPDGTTSVTAKLTALDSALSGKATPADITTAITNIVGGADGAFDTLKELETALGNDASFATTMTNALAGKAPLASPALTGTPTTPTATADTATTQIASTAFVINQASATTPAMDGTGTVGTSKKYARADHVHPSDSTKAPLASPALTGTPTAPTATAGTNTTQIANTAFVKSATDVISAGLPVISATEPTGNLWYQVL